jgi:type II secretory pathway component PulF
MTGSGIPLVDAISIARYSAGNQIFIDELGYIC